MARTVVVTGGSSGIGAAAAQRFSKVGAQVLVADLHPPGSEALAGLPYVQTDVRDPAQVQAAFTAAAEQFGSVDTAVLSAGLATTMGMTPETMDPETYHRLVDVNMHGVVNGIAVATPLIRAAGGGGIAVMASLAGLTPAVGDPFYSMTKFAVVGLIRTLGPQLAAEGIVLNGICPGFVDTPMIDPLRQGFSASDFPVIAVATVVDVILTAVTPEGGHGECWLIQPGRAPAPYRFRGVPGALHEDGHVQRVPSAVEAASGGPG